MARETLDYVLREMQSPEGGFYSATDADSEGVEGKFFVFTRREVRRAARAATWRALFCAYYDVRAEGNWEHTNVLWTPRPLAEVAAAELGCAPEQLETRSSPRRARVLYAARASSACRRCSTTRSWSAGTR